MTDSPPTVSVLITTYNHAPFIEEAIRSVLSQKTDFAVEILVGEDHSTDATGEIVEALRACHPHQIRVLKLAQNVGGHRNFAHLWAQARGEFIAWLEGDDFWCDDYKLQKQVEALRADPAAAICFAQTIKRLPDGTMTQAEPVSYFPRRSDFHDLVFGNYIHTPSVIYRRGLVDSYAEWITALPLGDFPMHLLHARKGHVIFLPEVLAIYRVHEAGAWSTRDKDYQLAKTAEVLSACLREMPLSLLQRWSLEASLMRFRRRIAKVRGEAVQGDRPAAAWAPYLWGAVIRFIWNFKWRLSRRWQSSGRTVSPQA